MNRLRCPRTNAATAAGLGSPAAAGDEQDATRGATTGATQRDPAGNRSGMVPPIEPPITSIRLAGRNEMSCGSGSIEIGGLPWLDHKEAATH